MCLISSLCGSQETGGRVGGGEYLGERRQENRGSTKGNNGGGKVQARMGARGDEDRG